MKGAGGFTLVETLLSLSVTGICLALSLPFIGFQRDVWERQTAVREEFENLSSALQWLSRDLQGAGYGWPGSPVVEVGTARISYVVPVGKTGRAPARREDMRLVTAYGRGGDLLYRIQGWDSLQGAWKRGSYHKLASNVQGLSFTALSDRGEATLTPGETRGVVIELDGRHTGRHRTFVALRNGRRD